MKILVVAATEEEIAVLKDLPESVDVDFLVTGIGMVATTYALTKSLTAKNEKYDLVINCGLAGSFDRSIAIGEAVIVAQDTFSEQGAQDDDTFLTPEKMGFNFETSFQPFSAPAVTGLRHVKGITVNTVHGNEDSIRGIIERLQPQTESMEGAAVFFVCELEHVPCIQLRTISNYVEKRNKSGWNIPLALRNLANAFGTLMNQLNPAGKEGKTHEHIVRLSLGFSPCPNDTFMFDALVNGKIDTGNLDFRVKIKDVETLNRLALEGQLDVTKLSFGVYSKVRDNYELLTAGSALGSGVGPLLIAKKEFDNPSKEIRSVAIPGNNTTAGFLFKMFYPEITDIREIVFSGIEEAVLSGKADAGVIIHESRFTYLEKGLKKISDLGELWENKTGQPIPLGGIAVRRSLNEKTKQEINQLVRLSVEYAFTHPDDSNDYVKAHSQEMSDEVRRKHIQLYVNEYSVDLGDSGRKSIEYFLGEKSKSNDKKLFII